MKIYIKKLLRILKTDLEEFKNYYEFDIRKIKKSCITIF